MLDYRSSKNHLSCLKGTHSLCSLRMWAQLSHIIIIIIIIWSSGEQTCFTTLRCGLSGLGEKYNWSLLQGLSRAGGNDFRPKDLYFQLPLKKKKKKLFFSLISMWRTAPTILVFSAPLQKFSMMLIKYNIIYWALFLLTLKHKLYWGIMFYIFTLF